MKEGQPTELSLALNNEVQTVTLAPALAASLLELLRLVSSGRGFRMTPVEAELTTQQAADLLNVSRPHLVKLLEEKQIPFTKTGRHHRIRAELLSPHGVEVRSSDDFIADTIEVDPVEAILALRRMRERFKSPNLDVETIIHRAEAQGLLQTATLMQDYRSLL